MADLYEHNINKVRFNMSATTIEEGQTIDFTERVWADPWPNSFVWNFEGVSPEVSNEENPTSVPYLNAGNYDVTLTISDECGYQESRTYSDTIKVTSTVGSDEISSSNSLINLSFLNQGRIVLKENIDQDLLRIYDLNGRVIDFNKNGMEIMITNSVVNGYYIIEAQTGAQHYSQKIKL